MIIVCPRCGILYSVDVAALSDGPPQIVHCSNCACEWLHTPESALPDSDEALRLLALSLGHGPDTVPGRQQPPNKTPASTPASAGARAAPSRKQEPTADRSKPAENADTAGAPQLTLARERVVRGETPPFEPSEEDRNAPALSGGGRAVAKHDYGEEDVDDDRVAAASRAPSPTLPDRDDRRPDDAGKPTIDPAPVLNSAGAAGDATIPPLPFDDDERIQSPPLPRSQKRRPRMAAIAIGAVAATVLVSVGLLAATRDAVIAAFPGAAGVYGAVGLAANDAFAEGLEIRGVSSTRSWNDGGQVLTVAGDLANIAKKPRTLPMVRVVLVDKSNAEVQEVVVRPPGETLPVGETVRFEAQITDPADTAERIKVSLAPRPAPS